MTPRLRLLAAVAAVVGMVAADAALAQKSGGILKVYHRDSPGSMSILEEATNSTEIPMMGVFNNLVLRDVAWHDGKPFTARDVRCTWELLLDKAEAKLRGNPRKAWYQNIDEVTADGDYEATFHLKRPQPALIALLASGYAPIYPCHVAPAQMRQHPIGTGPFKFAEFKPNEYIKVVKNEHYWKKHRPYLDGIEYTIIPNRSTAILSFIAGKFDLTFPFEVNRDAPPFDDPEMRRALALALDRKAFIDILTHGAGVIGGAMEPAPEGVWGLPPDILASVPGFGPNIEKNRAEARQIMEKLGYGPDKRLAVKVSARNIPIFRDPAVILIDQLKEIYVDGELDAVDTANWYPKVNRKDYKLGLNLTGVGVDDPDVQFYENFACGSQRNYTGYCNPELQKLFDQQSAESDQQKRK